VLSAFSILKYVLEQPGGVRVIRWLVTGVVVYSAVAMLRSARRERLAGAARVQGGVGE